MKQLICLGMVLIWSFSAALSHADSIPREFIKHNRSIRSTTLGDAVVAYPLGADAILYNPAALNNKASGYTNENLDYQHSFYSVNHSQALIYGRLGFGELQRVANGERVNVQSFGIGIQGQNHMSWGLVYKDIRYVLPADSGRGYSIDFGLLSPLSDSMLFGLMAKDIFHENVPVPASIAAGVSLFSVFRNIVFTMEAEYFRSTSELIYKFGSEYQLDPTLTLRMGYREGNASIGGIFVLPFGRIEYAVLTDVTRSDAPTTHQLGFYLGK